VGELGVGSDSVYRAGHRDIYTLPNRDIDISTYLKHTNLREEGLIQCYDAFG
jgi:hypothetical protein